MVNVYGFNLIRGQVYSKKGLHDHFNGQQQGGICTPSDYPIILLFDTDRGQQFGYHDIWTDEGVFLWVGEGAKGDQEFTRGNKAIVDHVENEEEVFLFKHRESNQYEYIDQMMCIGYTWKKGIDFNDEPRDTIVFQLARVESLDEYVEHYVSKDDLPLEELRKSAIDDTMMPPSIKERIQKIWQRSSKLKQYALKRANGFCEGCENKAPFITFEGRAYLEVHHITKISDGGLEDPRKVAAICPNCHRRAHYSRDREKFKMQLLEKIEIKENNLVK